MSQNVLQTDFTTGQTVNFIVRDANSAQVFNTNTNLFENYNSGNFSKYVIAAVEQGTSGFYTAAMPAAVPLGSYSVVAKQQIGGSPVETDPSIGWGNIQYTGTVLLSLAAIFTVSVSAFEGSAAKQSLTGAILKQTSKFTQDNAQTVATVFKTDSVTPFFTQTIVTNANLKPVQTLGEGS